MTTQHYNFLKIEDMITKVMKRQGVNEVFPKK